MTNKCDDLKQLIRSQHWNYKIILFEIAIEILNIWLTLKIYIILTM